MDKIIKVEDGIVLFLNVDHHQRYMIGKYARDML